MPKFSIGYKAVGTIWVTVEAESIDEAIAEADKQAGVVLCHECSGKVDELNMTGGYLVLNDAGEELEDHWND